MSWKSNAVGASKPAPLRSEQHSEHNQTSLAAPDRPARHKKSKKKMIKQALIFTLSALMLLTFSCRKSQQEDLPGSEIVFNAFLQEGDSIRPFSGVSKALEGDLLSGYSLSGTLTSALYLLEPFKSRIRFITDQNVNLDGTPMDGGARFKWSSYGNTYHSFTAYSLNPAGTAPKDGVTDVLRNTTGDGIGEDVFVTFQQSSDPAKQIDLLTGESMNLRVNSTSHSAVRVLFSHRLSKVSLRVYGSGAVNLIDCQAKIKYGDGYSAPINKMGSTSVNGLSTMRGSDGSYEYAPASLQRNSRHKGDFVVGGKFGVPQGSIDPSTSVAIGDLILLPQDVVTDWATLTLSYKVDGVMKTAACSMPPLQLRAMMEYMLHLNIVESSSDMQITGVAVKPWGSSSYVIDRLPGSYAISISPDKQYIPSDNKCVINVTSTSSWILDSITQGVVVDKLMGPSGKTEVAFDVPQALQQFEVIFSTVGDDGTRQRVKGIGYRSGIYVDPGAQAYIPGAQAYIPGAGGMYKVNLTTSAPWKASSTVSGVTFSPSSGGAGEAQVTITVPANLETTTRSVPAVFTTTVNGTTKTADWTGTQIALPAISLNNTEQFDISGAGGIYTVKLTSNGYWRANSTVDGVTFSTSGGGAGTDILVDIIVPANPTGTARDIPVVFTATVDGVAKAVNWIGYQRRAATISLSNTTQWDIPTAGGSYSVQVTSNGPWTTITDASGVTVSPNSGADGVTNVTIRVLANGGPARDIPIAFTATTEGTTKTVTWRGLR